MLVPSDNGILVLLAVVWPQLVAGTAGAYDASSGQHTVWPPGHGSLGLVQYAVSYWQSSWHWLYLYMAQVQACVCYLLLACCVDCAITLHRAYMYDTLKGWLSLLHWSGAPCVSPVQLNCQQSWLMA